MQITSEAVDDEDTVTLMLSVGRRSMTTESKQIRVSVAADGTISAETVGFTGPSCLDQVCRPRGPARRHHDLERVH